MKEYEVYIPLTYNDGSPVENRKIDEIGELLLEQFGGYTFFPQTSGGHWRMGKVDFHEKIAIFRVLVENTKQARKFFKRLKEELKESLKQEEILIVAKDADTL